MKVYRTYSSDETRKLGAEFAKRALGVRRQVSGVRNAKVFALLGNLGSGKTTFAQGFLRGLGVRKRVNSPTFVLMKRFAIRNKQFTDVYHIDVYRLKKAKELLNLGLREILKDSERIVLIEWAERLKRYLPKNTVWVRFEHCKDGKERRIAVI